MSRSDFGAAVLVSCGVPAEDARLVALDIANTGVARGKVYAALQRGEPVPEGWALDGMAP